MIAHKVIQCPSGTCVCDTLPLQLYIYLIVYLIYWLFLYLFLFLLRLPRLSRSSRTLWMGRVWKGGHRCSTPQTWPACFVALVLPFVQVPGLHNSVIAPQILDVQLVDIGARCLVSQSSSSQHYYRFPSHCLLSRLLLTVTYCVFIHGDPIYWVPIYCPCPS